MNRQLLAGLAGLVLILPSCATVEVKPIKVEPIYITVDVNIRVDRQLDNFFAFEQPNETQPATQPANQQTSMEPHELTKGVSL
ncbi:MAG TPA: hypothetical protein VHP11_04145 [Tepidisphaeraceae bacterium]|nr:hypothetical protein [Tepidisphaeraceae bacterium]